MCYRDAGVDIARADGLKQRLGQAPRLGSATCKRWRT
jgi:hypothetical protein